MNLQALMNVRPAIEEGLRGWFSDQAIAAYTRRNSPEQFQNVRPRTEILCKLGQATGHKKVINGVLYNDTWNFELAVRCVCDPQNTEPNNLEVEQLVSQTRGMMQTFGQATWVDTVNFPNHLIVEPLRETTTDDTLMSDENEEYSVLNFTGIAQVRTSSWLVPPLTPVSVFGNPPQLKAVPSVPMLYTIGIGWQWYNADTNSLHSIYLAGVPSQLFVTAVGELPPFDVETRYVDNVGWQWFNQTDGLWHTVYILNGEIFVSDQGYN